MAYEDLTTFTESDADSKLTVTSTRVTATEIYLQQNPAPHVVKNYGSGYFDDIYAYVDAYYEAVDAGNWAFDMFCFKQGSSAGGFNALTNSEWGFGLNDDGTGTRVYGMRGAFAVYDTTQMVADSVNVYFTILRDSGAATVNLYVYSDSNRATLVDVLAITGLSMQTWQYMFAFDHTIQSGTKRSNSYFEKIDLSPSSGNSGPNPTSASTSFPNRSPFIGNSGPFN